MAIETFPQSSSSSLPFQEWQRAVAALRAAEAQDESHSEMLRLSAEVIRTRNALTVDRLQAGWQPHAHVLNRLVVDDQLLLEGDDSTP